MINSSHKQLAVLIDPDKVDEVRLKNIVDQCVDADVDLILVGGSLLFDDCLDRCVEVIKSSCSIPVYLFPGDPSQICCKADGILLLSVISGRNAEMLIGRHVVAAPRLKASGLQVCPTGYILIDGGRPTSVSYMSGTTPIPHDKDDIAVCTAIAGEMLGMKAIYLEGGSGAANTVSLSMIAKVKKNINIPLFVGGGIDTPEKVCQIAQAGADIIVVGTAIENGKSSIKALKEALRG